MLMFQGFARTGDGMLKVIGLPVGTAPPAGTQFFNGIGRHPDGSMYVVFA